MDTEYSKRELDEKFSDLKESLDRIEAQTIRHNNRLTKMEKWIYTMAGAITMLGFLATANYLNLP